MSTRSETNPTPSKPAHKYAVTQGSKTVTGFFIDESAARQAWSKQHGDCGAFPPTVTLVTPYLSDSDRT